MPKRSIAALALAAALVLPATGMAQPALQVEPQQGATSMRPQVLGAGLPESSEVQVYGGADRERMALLGTARTDVGGELRFSLDIPEVGDGDLFYIAVDAGDGLVFTEEPFLVASPSEVDVK